MPVLLFLKSKWGMIACAALLVVLVLALTYCSGKNAGESEADLAREKANVEALATASAAAEKAAEERGIADAIADAQRKELDDAKRDCTSVDDCRVRRGCIVLRQQGKDLASIPACRRFADTDGAAVSN